MKNVRAYSAGVAFALAILFNLCVQFVVALVIAGVMQNLQSGAIDALTANGIQSLLTVIASVVLQLGNLLAVVIVLKNVKDKKERLIKKPSIKNTIFACLCCIVVFLGFFPISLWASEGFSNLGASQPTISLEGVSGVIMAINVLVIAPIFEEILFRFVIFNGCKNSFSPLIGCVVSALAFALMHLNPHQLVYQFALGFVCSLLYWRTNNLFYSIITHSLSNALGFAIGFFPTIAKFVTQNPIMLVVAIVLVVVASFGIWLLCKKLSVEEKQEITTNAREETKKENVTGAIVLLCVSALLCLLFILLAFVNVA